MRDGDYPEEALRPFRAVASKYLAGIWIALSGTVIISILSLEPSFIPEGQEASLWFQRSGSITTIGALFIGIFAENLRSRLRGQFMGTSMRCVFLVRSRFTSSLRPLDPLHSRLLERLSGVTETSSILGTSETNHRRSRKLFPHGLRTCRTAYLNSRAFAGSWSGHCGIGRRRR